METKLLSNVHLYSKKTSWFFVCLHNVVMDVQALCYLNNSIIINEEMKYR